MSSRVLLGAENIDQNAWGAINGCEAASLLEGLHYQNRADQLNYGQFLLKMPISADDNPYHGFGGSPFKNQSGKFEAIFTRPLMRWGSQYGHLQELSGADPQWLYDAVRHGNPVLTFVTVHFEDPDWDIYPFGKVPTNNHAVLLDGLDGDQVHVSDPIDGQYWLPQSKFERIYNSRRMAIAINK
ncbi:C39 family peptidase [Lentilactobacillus otakiensis]|uniref:C39 family peptidase n=1 Tax=Lentilactobacillus otakiensis TaxID=481720 RepID=UPI003D185625